MERVPREPVHFTSEEQAAVSNFQDTHTWDKDGRYHVQLPRKKPTPVLGVSRVAAKRRLQQTKRSLHATDEVICTVANGSSGIKSSYVVHVHNAMLVIAFLQGLHHLVI